MSIKSVDLGIPIGGTLAAYQDIPKDTDDILGYMGIQKKVCWYIYPKKLYICSREAVTDIPQEADKKMERKPMVHSYPPSFVSGIF